MASQQVNFDVDQGSDFRFDVELLDINNDPIDLTNVLIVGQIRKTASSKNIEAEFSIDPTDLVKGQFAIILPASVTSQLKCDPSHSAYRTMTLFSYDVEIHYPTGQISRILQGVLSVSPEVTR